MDWINTRERLPGLHSGIKLIAYITAFGVKTYTVATWVGDAWIVELGKRHGINEYVTHWMDLPSPESAPSVIFKYYCAKCVRAIYSGSDCLKIKCCECKQPMHIQD